MQINKILFITLSNIGDVILTLPALDQTISDFPKARVSVVSTERSKELFENNPAIDKVFVYDKRAGFREKKVFFRKLKNEKFDLVIDLRNSLLQLLLPARFKTSPLTRVPAGIEHMKDRHLYRAYSWQLTAHRRACGRHSLVIGRQEKEYIARLLRENGFRQEEKIIVIAPGARSHTKRWPREKFRELAESLAKDIPGKIVLAGDKADMLVSGYLKQGAGAALADLSGKTTLIQLAALLEKTALVVTNDSAVLHLASYLDVPVAAIFGPTNERQYGPWGAVSVVIKKEIFCRPCQKAQCRFGNLECLRLIKSEEVLKQVKNILTGGPKPLTPNPKPYKRILIVRTDRIGDVLLSTPVIKALRDAYPNAYIAMMVAPQAREIVEGNPYLDETIIYDKSSAQKGLSGTLRFTRMLKGKKFDLALVLHPANRAHLAVFLAGIPRRIGYDRKLGFLLTDRVKHAKQLGEKHESDYALDLVRFLGVEPGEKKLHMPVSKISQEWAQEVLTGQGVGNQDKLLAIHPAASCPSKIWPPERFAEAADKLADKYGFRILIISAGKDIPLAHNLERRLVHPVINLAGKTSVSQLAGILKKCALFISNDSGPVHIAAAVGTPVISIFGRNQAGLSPRRWGPLGEKSTALHKPAACIECLAHNCKNEFLCLKSISVDDVVKAADNLLR